jgi:hypothetical protein
LVNSFVWSDQLAGIVHLMPRPTFSVAFGLLEGEAVQSPAFKMELNENEGEIGGAMAVLELLASEPVWVATAPHAAANRTTVRNAAADGRAILSVNGGRKSSVTPP